MDQISKSVLESVEAGEYFEDANKWYASKYIYPFTERSFLIIIFFTVIFGFFSLSYTVYNSFPITRDETLLVKNPDTIKYFATLKKLGDERILNPNIQVFSYLIGNYVKNYESYSKQNLPAQMAFVKNNSSKQVFKQFDEYLSIENPESPILMLQDAGRRKIEIISIDFYGDLAQESEEVIGERGNGMATIRFKAKTTNIITKKTVDSLWEAKLNIQGSDIRKFVKNENSIFQFTVTKYDVKKVTKS